MTFALIIIYIVRYKKIVFFVWIEETMAKQQSFGDKVAKAQQKQQKICPVCNAPLSFVKIISPTPMQSGGYSFRPKMERVCKCSNPDLAGS